MGFSPKLLAQGEHVELELRTHVKQLLLPVIALVLTIAGAGALIWLADNQGWSSWAMWVVLGLALVALLLWVVVPLLRWRTTIFVVTNRRLISRTGIITRTGRDIPLYRINDVTYEKGLTDRILGCGTLIVSDATDKDGVKLHDVPNVERVHVRMNELLHDVDDGGDDGTFPPNEPRRPRGTQGYR